MSELFKNRYRIQSIRLPGWDYRNAGGYFVTICIQNRECYFGNIVNGEIVLSETGKIANKFWLEIPDHSKYVQLDEFVIMPNHVHGILFLLDNEIKNPINHRDVACNVSTVDNKPIDPTSKMTIEMSKLSPKPGSISTIIRSYKSAVKRWTGMNGYKNFSWQPRFYDRIIRNDRELQHIREYVLQNPQKWDIDMNHTQFIIENLNLEK